MEKVYMVCDYTDSKASSISGTPNIGIEETDWNQCDSCGKPIYDEEPAVSPTPTFDKG